MKLIYEITVFPLISILSLFLISNLLGEVLIRGQCKTVLYEFIWMLVLLLLQYGNFSYKCPISCCDPYRGGAALLERTLTSMRVLKGAAKVLCLVKEMW